MLVLREINYNNLSKFFNMNEIGNDTLEDETDYGGFQRLRTVRMGGLNVNDNMNIILGSIMIVMVLFVVCCIFYLSHRNLRKRTNTNRRRWLDSDANMEIYSVEQFFDMAPAPENSPSETPPSILERSGPPPPYDTVVSKDDIIIEPLLRNINLQSAPPSPLILFSKHGEMQQQSNTPIHECCCCNTKENFEYIKKCKTCGKEIETKHSSANSNIDYCDCTETDTSITVNQLTTGDSFAPTSIYLDTPINDGEFEFVDDDNNNQREWLSSTGTLISPQQEIRVDEIVERATTSTSNDYTNNNYTNTMNHTNQTIVDIDNYRQHQYNNKRIAAIDRTGLPTYDTAIRLAAVAAASRGSTSQLTKLNN